MFKILLKTNIPWLISLTLWILNNWTPWESPYNTADNVPPVRSVVSNFVTICSMNLFLEGPIKIGTPKLWKIEILESNLKLCPKFFPNPIPGSIIIKSLLKPFNFMMTALIYNVRLSLQYIMGLNVPRS